MTLKKTIVSGVAVLAVLVTSVIPESVAAQDHRQKTKNDWRNLAIGSAAVGLYGLNKGDSTLTLLGAAGALYSADRYEKDRKSQGADQRRRAAIFKRGYYYSHGHKYVKRTVYKNGHKYYRFVRV